jgi:hypothetical protein
MDKASRKAFERQMAQFNAEALAVFGIAQALLARNDSPSAFGVPMSHHGHQADIVAELVRNSPALVGVIAVLLALGEHENARDRVKAALDILRSTDPAIFAGACSPRLAARILVGPGADRDTWTSAVSSMTYANDDDRRRRILPYLRKMVEDGRPLPTEADVANLFTRDQAIAEQMRTGGGALAGRH